MHTCTYIHAQSNVNKDVSNKNDDTNDTCDAGRIIIDIIKENMVKEKEYNAEIIKILKEQVEYFINEIIHKNTLIEKLIIKVNARNNELPPNYQMLEDRTNSRFRGRVCKKCKTRHVSRYRVS